MNSYYTCCEDGMLSQVPPSDNSGLCPACRPATPPAGGESVAIDRGDAVNLARNMLDHRNCKGITSYGVRVLCEAILKMDAAIATPPAAVPMSQKTQDGHSVSSVAEAPTTLPLFAVGVAQRKWESLQADGYRMQRMEFARSIDGQEKRGIIDPWGRVLWKYGQAGDQPPNGHGPESAAPQPAGTQSDTERDAARYRWLKAENSGPIGIVRYGLDGDEHIPAANIDAEVDAAMGNQSAGKESHE